MLPMACEPLGSSLASASRSWATPARSGSLADLGAQAIGAIVYGIYPTAPRTSSTYQMADGGAVVFVAEDQEYVDKILQVADRLPDLRCDRRRR